MAVAAPAMLMPKAPVHKDNFLSSFENQVGGAGEPSIVEAVSIAEAVEIGANQ